MLVTILVPLILTPEPRLAFYKTLKPTIVSILLVAVPFILWDKLFVMMGIWGFNPYYITGVQLFNLPLEEVLFFLFVPYACIFIDMTYKRYFADQLILNKYFTIFISMVLILIAVALLVFNLNQAYTLSALTLFIFLLAYSLVNNTKLLNRFLLSFCLMLVGFFFINGILTGSFISGEVVWYNNLENSGFRVGTIPVEDFFYGFDLILAVTLIRESFLK
jgi:lycopene cyclase domain-containing protein